MEKKTEIPFVSVFIVAVNVILFFACDIYGERLYYSTELDPKRVLVYGEYWRTVSAMFVHANIEHLFNNMVILLFMGAMIEKGIGHVAFGLIYIISGLGGNFLSLLYKVINHIDIASVGASAAIFGMDGLLLAVVLFSRKRIPDVTPKRLMLMIILTLYSGFRSSNIDNAAHVGGLVTGFSLGVIYCIISQIFNNMRKGRG